MRKAITIYAVILVTALSGLAAWGCCGIARHLIVAMDKLGDAGAGFAQTAAQLNDPRKGTIKMLNEDVGATKSLIVHADLVTRHEQQQLDTWDARGAQLFSNANGAITDLRGTINASTGAIADLRTTITASTGTLNETTATLRAAGPAITDLDGLIRSFAATAPDVQRAVKGIADTSQQTAAIGTNLNATTHDLQVALHPILNPEPCATRGCKIKRALSAAKAAGPGAEGIYYLIEVGKLIF